MNHKWTQPNQKKSATCSRCGLHREVRPYLLKRPVFGNRTGRRVLFFKDGERTVDQYCEAAS